MVMVSGRLAIGGNLTHGAKDISLASLRFSIIEREWAMDGLLSN
jgi:hypothetical protein